MAKRIFCLVLGLSLVAAPDVFAQAGTASYQPSGPKKQLATIIFSGLGGAVLGLSTLSFYGRPQDKLNNIAIGFAIGVIGGTMYTTYQAATKPRSFYSDHFLPEVDEAFRLEPQQPLKLSYQFDF